MDWVDEESDLSTVVCSGTRIASEIAGLGYRLWEDTAKSSGNANIHTLLVRKVAPNRLMHLRFSVTACVTRNSYQVTNLVAIVPPELALLQSVQRLLTL
jgi:hypothetical protein